MLTLIGKEIQESVYSLRFLITTILCVLIIPLGIYVSLKEYERRFSDFQNSVKIYEERSAGGIGSHFVAEGYRSPSPMSIFSVGLENFLPTKVITSNDGEFKVIGETEIVNPLPLLFGKLDFLFNIGFIVSLVAIIFTFSAISNEKENGTLSLIMSYSIPRWKILLSKTLGNYIVFLVPFIIAVTIGILILNISGIYPILSRDMFIKFSVILIITLIFIFCIFNLGLLISSLNKNSITAMIMSLFIWVLMLLVVPKISPMIAGIVYPVESRQLIEAKKRIIKEDLTQELNTKKRSLLEKLLMEHGFDTKITLDFGDSEDEQKVLRQYEESILPIEEEYQDRIALETRKIEEDFSNKLNRQISFAMYLSRISPFSCYTYLLTEISGTGLIEVNNFKEYAQRFQNEAQKGIYDKYKVRVYMAGNRAIGRSISNGFDSKDISVPNFNYNRTPLKNTLIEIWIDIMLLVLFTILFFISSYVSFIRYDVR